MVAIHGIGQLYFGVLRLEGAAPSAAATRPCGDQAGERAFLNQTPLKLGQGRKGGKSSGSNKDLSQNPPFFATALFSLSNFIAGCGC